MTALEHDVASVCAVACAALSLILAMNMSHLRNKARSLGGKDQEKAFLDGPEFAKARPVRAARAPGPRVLSSSCPSWLLARAGLAGAAQHARVHAAVLRAHAVPAHSRCHAAPAHQRRCSVRSRRLHLVSCRAHWPSTRCWPNTASLTRERIRACKRLEHRSDRLGGALRAERAGCGAARDRGAHDLRVGPLHGARGSPGGHRGAGLTARSRARAPSGRRAADADTTGPHAAHRPWPVRARLTRTRTAA